MHFEGSLSQEGHCGIGPVHDSDVITKAKGH